MKREGACKHNDPGLPSHLLLRETNEKIEITLTHMHASKVDV